MYVRDSNQTSPGNYIKVKTESFFLKMNYVALALVQRSQDCGICCNAEIYAGCRLLFEPPVEVGNWQRDYI